MRGGVSIGGRCEVVCCGEVGRREKIVEGLFCCCPKKTQRNLDCDVGKFSYPALRRADPFLARACLRHQLVSSSPAQPRLARQPRHCYCLPYRLPRLGVIAYHWQFRGFMYVHPYRYGQRVRVRVRVCFVILGADPQPSNPHFLSSYETFGLPHVSFCQAAPESLLWQKSMARR